MIISSFDFEDHQDILYGVDLSPGTYVLLAQDSDPEDAPDIPVEKILITVS